MSRLARVGDGQRATGRVGATATLAVLAVFITVLSWPFPNRAPTIGLDPSWHIALHLAASMDLRQGVDMVFTYGPLGFLSIPTPYLGVTTLFALLATVTIYFALVAILLVEARRVVPLWAAVLIVLAIGRTFVALPPFEAFQALVFVVCVEALADRINLPTPAIAVAIGIGAGFASLGKLNVGVFIAAMGAVTAMSIDRRWWRGLAVWAVAAVATGLVGWTATGQRFGDLAAYASGAMQLISGYSDAMGTDPIRACTGSPRIRRCGRLFVWTAVWMSARWRPRRRIGLLAICLILAFAMWKTAFTREYPSYTFSTMLVGLAVVGAPLLDRRLWLTSLLVVGVTFLAVARLGPGTYVNVVASARSLTIEAVTAVDPEQRPTGVGGHARNAAIEIPHRCDHAWRADRRTVAIDPTEARWRMRTRSCIGTPADHAVVLGLYARTRSPERGPAGLGGGSGTDPALGPVRRQAGRLAIASARSSNPPGGVHPVHRRRALPLVRGPRGDAADVLPLPGDDLDRYLAGPRPVGRGCGPAEPLGTISAQDGESVKVPVETRPDDSSRFGARSRAVAPRSSPHGPVQGGRMVRDDRRLGYRLVAPTASDGLLLAVPPSADGTGPFAFGPPMNPSRSSRGRDMSIGP